MKNLVRGGVILSILSLFVAFIYAQTRTEKPLSIANDSQQKLNNTVTDTNIEQDTKKVVPEVKTDENSSTPGDINDNDKNKKKLVEKTVISKAAGVSRGSFTATAYCLRGRTATGAGVRRGIVAADRRVLPMGTRINLGAGAYSGSYLVADTGGAVKGRKLDIWMASCAEARRFGRRSVSVSVLGR